jgi:Ni/Co efflux regulator RcnB
MTIEARPQALLAAIEHRLTDISEQQHALAVEKARLWSTSRRCGRGSRHRPQSQPRPEEPATDLACHRVSEKPDRFEHRAATRWRAGCDVGNRTRARELVDQAHQHENLEQPNRRV